MNHSPILNPNQVSGVRNSVPLTVSDKMTTKSVAMLSSAFRSVAYRPLAVLRRRQPFLISLRLQRCFADAPTAFDVSSSTRESAAELSSSQPVSSFPVELLFIRPDVQQILSRLTGRNMEKILSRRQVKDLRRSELKLLTEDQLNRIREEKFREIEGRLRMPPVMPARQPREELIVNDPLLENYETHKHVFMDITYGVKPRNRKAFVRELDGTLRTVTWEELDKLNNIYFPIEGRDMDFPAVYEDANLQAALDKGFHEYLLGRALVQFEPDNPQYIRITRTIYEHIDSHRKFDVLESTRFMGGLIFFLASQKKADNFLMHLLQNNRMDGVTDLLQLHYTLHPERSEEFQKASEEGEIAAVKYYIASEAVRKGNLELAVQAYQETLRQLQEASAIEMNDLDQQRIQINS